MENIIKCFNKKHKDVDAIIYCAQCSEYMCNKCANYHTELFEEHTKYNLDKENKKFSLENAMKKIIKKTH